MVVSKLFERGGLFELVFDIKAPRGRRSPDRKAVAAGRGTAERDGQSDVVVCAGHLRHPARRGRSFQADDADVARGSGVGHRPAAPPPRAGCSDASCWRWCLPLRRWASRLAPTKGTREENARPAAELTDSPRRLPDGRVFVPKATQRILDVRTSVVRPQTKPKAVVFVGRVIANPNRSGLVQSINGGRVIAPGGRASADGAGGRKGDVLASIEPPMPIADRTTISERMGEIEQLHRRRRSKAAAACAPWRSASLVPQSLVVETEAELEGLAPAARGGPRDPDRARSLACAHRRRHRACRAWSPGQVVQAQDVLFQIVDPEIAVGRSLRLWRQRSRRRSRTRPPSAPATSPMKLALPGLEPDPAAAGDRAAVRDLRSRRRRSASASR